MRIYPSKYKTGDRVGSMTLLSSYITNQSRWWNCKCDCGVEKSIRQYSLRHCVSCGCVNRARRKAGIRKTHGMRRTPEYASWSKMIQRCQNPKVAQFRWYGGRGIGVCEEWRVSFEKFLSDMGLRPSPKHSLDRIDTDSDYAPGNCRWATQAEQVRNRRNTVFVELAGERLPLAEVAERHGVKYKSLHKKLRSGLSIEAALAVAVTWYDQNAARRVA